MKGRTAAIAAVVMSTIMGMQLTGCGSNATGGDGKGAVQAGGTVTETGKADSEDKNIVFWNVGTEGADKKIYEYAMDKFEAEAGNGYKIDNQPTQNDKYKEKLVIAMSSGECPDAYTTWSGGPMDEYIKSGFAQPLDELYEKYGLKDRFMEGALEQASYNGKIYGIPVKNISIAGIYYNKDLFDKYNVKVPSTLSELKRHVIRSWLGASYHLLLPTGPNGPAPCIFSVWQPERAGWNHSKRHATAAEALKRNVLSMEEKRFRNG